MRDFEVVAAIVVDRGEILACRRGASKYPYLTGRFEFPGGKREVGESPEQALRRELSEELGWEVEIVRPYAFYDYEYPDMKPRLRFFLCRAASRDFELREHAEARWVKPSEIAALDWVPADASVVEALSRERFDGEVA